MLDDPTQQENICKHDKNTASVLWFRHLVYNPFPRLGPCICFQLHHVNCATQAVISQLSHILCVWQKPSSNCSAYFQKHTSKLVISYFPWVFHRFLLFRRCLMVSQVSHNAQPGGFCMINSLLRPLSVSHATNIHPRGLDSMSTRHTQHRSCWC